MRPFGAVGKVFKPGVEIVDAHHRLGSGLVGARPRCRDFDHGV